MIMMMSEVWEKWPGFGNLLLRHDVERNLVEQRKNEDEKIESEMRSEFVEAEIWISASLIFMVVEKVFDVLTVRVCFEMKVELAERVWNGLEGFSLFNCLILFLRIV